MLNNLKIAFAIDNLGANQIASSCINSANIWLKNNFNINISIFYQENAPPCMYPNFARFNIIDAAGFDGHLISTSISTVFSTNNITTAKRYYYINDLEWIRPSFRFSKKEFNSVLSDNLIIKFTRSYDYYDYIINRYKEKTVNLVKNIVSDFDINDILEIIYANNK